MRKNQAGAFYAQASLVDAIGQVLHKNGADRPLGEKFRVLHNFCG